MPLAGAFSLLAALASSFEVELLITREVRGAQYPVNRWNTQCENATATPCDCFGGASRRHAALASARNGNAVAIDTGAFASGSGTFYAAFHGDAAKRYFGAAGYATFGLNYRDLARDNLITYLDGLPHRSRRHDITGGI